MGSLSSGRGGRGGRLRVAIILDRVATVEDGPPDASGVLASAEAVSAALRVAGHEPVVVPLLDDVAAWVARLDEGKFDLVFNLCESVSGHAALEPLPAAAVQWLGMPETGAGPWTLAVCLRKDVTNAVLRAHGIAVPPWTVIEAGAAPAAWRHYPAIVKPAAEDASIGIGPDAVVHDADALAAVVARGHRRWGRVLVQQFIDGRELNLGIVGRRVLPPAEIDFAGLPGSLPPILTYAAKWTPGSPDHRGTVPRCPAELSPRLVDRLRRLARDVWGAVEGVGYGRIDVRMDGGGRLFVIDVNPNPDLSPAAGLARQAAAAGWDYGDLVTRIVDDALARHRGVDPRRPRAARRVSRQAAPA
jgi:D-alanine-D-alanine ligase